MLAVGVRRLLRRFGVDLVRRRPGLVDLLKRHGIDTVFDVGANTGQYAKHLRKWGYRGRIVSLEPVTRAYRALEASARRDPDWEVLNVALGDTDSTTTINVSRETIYSSILDGAPALRTFGHDSVVTDREQITVNRLDTVIDGLRGNGRALFLKVDTQGYERQVLAGATRSLREFRGVQLELSLTPLYQGEAPLVEMVKLLQEEGFTMVLVEPVVFDAESCALLQCDCVFIRRAGALALSPPR